MNTTKRESSPCIRASRPCWTLLQTKHTRKMSLCYISYQQKLVCIIQSVCIPNKIIKDNSVYTQLKIQTGLCYTFEWSSFHQTLLHHSDSKFKHHLKKSIKSLNKNAKFEQQLNFKWGPSREKSSCQSRPPLFRRFYV